MKPLTIKEALVYREYKNNKDMNMCYLTGFPMQFKALEIGDIKITKKEVTDIFQDLVKREYLYKDMTINDLLSKDGRLIKYIKEPSSEQQLIALQNNIPNSIREISNLSLEAKRYILENSTCGEWEWIEEYWDGAIIALLEINPDIALLIPEEKWTQEMVYAYLKKMVNDNRSELIDDYQHRVKIPNALRDKVYYRAYCMVNGYNFSKIPTEYINEKIIDYCLDHETSFVGTLWMYRNIPDEFKTLDRSLKCCFKHFACVEYLPNYLMTDVFCNMLMDAGQYNIAAALLKHCTEDTIVRMLIEGRKSCQTVNIPKDKMTQKIANAMASCNNALEQVPKKYQTKEFWEIRAKGNAHGISQVENLTDDILIEAARKNILVVVSEVPAEKLSENFWKTVAEENLFVHIKNFPKQYAKYLTQEVICKHIIKRPYELEHLTEDQKQLVTDECLMACLEENPRHWDNVLKFRENTAIRNKILEIAESEYQKFYMITQFSYVEPEIIDSYIETQPNAITLKGINKEQIKKSISCFPENILLYPNIFTDKEKPVAAKEEKTDYKSIFDRITVETKYEQMSIWDIIVA